MPSGYTIYQGGKIDKLKCKICSLKVIVCMQLEIQLLLCYITKIIYVCFWITPQTCTAKSLCTECVATFSSWRILPFGTRSIFFSVPSFISPWVSNNLNSCAWGLVIPHEIQGQVVTKSSTAHFSKWQTDHVPVSHTRGSNHFPGVFTSWFTRTACLRTRKHLDK